MKNRSKFIYLSLIVVCIVLIIVGAFVISDKKLDIEGDLVKKLYGYLGETDIYHCGGLNVYSSSLVNKDTLTNENRLCMAYYELEMKESLKSDSTGTNKFGTKICKVGDSTTLAVSDDTNSCEYYKVDKESLNNAYKNIYGENISEFEKFFISSEKACEIEGDIYYCGFSETFNYSIAPEATIYRGIAKAIEKFNGDIVIYDYFLKISNNKCYKTNTSNEEVTDCSKAISENSDLEINSEFISKYGTLYKHTYAKKDSNIYWISSEEN